MQFTDVLAALQHSHDRFSATVRPLSAEQAGQQSYADDWTIAQVASHLGSGAEIFQQIVNAGLEQSPAPGADGLQPVWDAWNSKPARDQVADAVRANAAFLDQVASLAPAERDGWRLDVFGEQRTLPGLLQLRLCEHAVHTWDIAVALDPAATVAPDAAALILGLLPMLAGWTGKGSDDPVTVHVTTSDPHLEFLLQLSPGHTELAAAAGPADGSATLQLPAEALVRLVYGRLDPGHTPSAVTAAGVDLAALRRAFPGF
ncbi:MAG TPA: maleylpyruvate isomerase family mycothiol-dependent enzyme [Streptosporangiaceae bacterium]|jgi:uncharacterized protein (TIGR03083 family)